MTKQQRFVAEAVSILSPHDNVMGLAAAGSWITNEMDSFSDVDLVLVTNEKIGGDREAMLRYARLLPHFVSGFTGEHVGEPRVLICLYDQPLLHVDIKFVTLDEFKERIETPVILLDKDGHLQRVIEDTKPILHTFDFQWIEDRFWTWIHYALLKIGRGELMEAYDFLGFLRMVVFGPMLQIKNGLPPRGVRKVEARLSMQDLQQLQSTLATYSSAGLVHGLKHCVDLYKVLQVELFPSDITLQKPAELAVMRYFEEMEQTVEKKEY